MDVVIARHTEDLGWASALGECGLHIYDKGGDDVPGHTPLPNVGREAHTYLTHILRNYDGLAEHTCFLQGNPADHLSVAVADLPKLDPGGWDFVDLSSLQVACNLHHCTHLLDWVVEELPLYETYRRIFLREHRDFTMVFGAGAQFIVSRAAILRHPREAYERALATVDHSVKPPQAYCLERLWPVIFLGEEFFLGGGVPVRPQAG